VRFRKEEEIRKGAAKLRARADARAAPAAASGDVKILTSCPSCLQGLSRYNEDANLEADYIVVEMARQVLGENWMADYVARQQWRHRARAGLMRACNESGRRR
jgi:hypothetical protein